MKKVSTELLNLKISPKKSGWGNGEPKTGGRSESNLLQRTDA